MNFARPVSKKSKGLALYKSLLYLMNPTSQWTEEEVLQC